MNFSDVFQFKTFSEPAIKGNDFFDLKKAKTDENYKKVNLSFAQLKTLCAPCRCKPKLTILPELHC